jgi:hypothetical protein
VVHHRKKLAPGIVDSYQFPHIELDLAVWAQCRSPGEFSFGNPRALQSAGEFDAAFVAALVNRDA